MKKSYNTHGNRWICMTELVCIRNPCAHSRALGRSLKSDWTLRVLASAT